MAKTGQIAVITILTLLGVGALGGGFLLSDTVEQKLDKGINDNLVISPDEKGTDDFKDWLTNEDPGDPPKFKKYYFWNLTNSDEYLAGATPVLEQIGPYAFRQYDRKVESSVVWDSAGNEISYKTFTYFIFDAGESATGLSVNDKIVNVNPAYLGVMAGAGSEAALVTAFVGPTVEKIADALVLDFGPKAKITAIATGLNTIIDGLTGSFPFSVSATALTTIMESLAGSFTDAVKVKGAAGAVAAIMDGLTGAFTGGVKASGAADAVATIMDGLLTGFVPGLFVTQMPTVLEAVQTKVSDGLKSVIEAVATAGLINGSTGKGALISDFFNSTSFKGDWSAPIKGVSEFAGAGLNFTITAAELILINGSQILGIPGWIQDLATGTGVLGYLQAYQKAADVTDTSLTLDIMGAAYNATPTQLGAAAGYLQDVMANEAQALITGGSTVAGAGAFYQQWANSTFSSTPLDLDSNSTTSDGFELGSLSNISMTDAMALWDNSSATAFTNESGIKLWFGAALGNTTLFSMIAAAYPNLNTTTQIPMIMSWLSSFKDGFSKTSIMAKLGATLGIQTEEDIAYVQWGQPSLTNGVGLKDLDDSVLAAIEYWNSTGNTLNLTNSRALLSGFGNLTTAEGMGTFLVLGNQTLYANATAQALLNGFFGSQLGTSEILGLFTYVNYLWSTFVLPALPVDSFDDVGYYHWGNGAITDGISLVQLDDGVFFPVELWNITGYSLNLTNSLALLNGSTYNLTDAVSVGTFLALGYNATELNDAVALGTLNFLFGTKLNTTDVAMVMQYLTTVQNTLVLADIGTTFGISGFSFDDVQYLQWSNGGLTEGISVVLLDDDNSTNTPIEFWAVSGSSMSFDNAKALLSGSLNLTDATGVGTFFALGSKAAAGDATSLAQLNGAFGSSLSASEAGAVMAYILDVLDTLALPGVPVNSLADVGYFQMINSALTNGFSVVLLDDDPTNDGAAIEYWSTTTTPLDLSDVKPLFTGIYNLTDATSLGTFLVLGQQAVGGNVTALATINALFGTSLDAAETGALLGYITYVQDNLVLPQLKLIDADVTYADLGYLQWVNGALTSGLSVKDLDETSTLPGAPEFWASTNSTLSLANSKALLTGSLNLTTTDGVGLILLSAEAIVGGDTAKLAAVNTAFGTTLTTSEYLQVVSYVKYLMKVFIAEATLAPIFAQGGGLVTTRTVNEWLWNVTDPLLNFLKANGQVDDASNNLFTNQTKEAEALETNATTFKTGADDINQVKQYVKWNGLTEIVNVWKDHTEKVRGTDATQFHPGVDKDEKLLAWVGELQRAVNFVFSEDMIVEDIGLLKFVLSDNVLGVNDTYYQTTKGLANMTSSVGAPLFLSKPHFLDSDLSSSLLTTMGMKSNRAQHDTYVAVEPTTGATLDARKRLQINFLVGSGNFFTSGVSENYVPLMWVEDGGTITPELAQSFRDSVYAAQNIQQLSSVGGPALGILLLISAMFVGVRTFSTKP